MARDFFQVDNAVITEYAKKVEPAGIAIYCLLKQMANRDHECWPSLDTIHNVLGVAKGTALKYLGYLEAHGLIQKRTEPKDARRLRYRIVPLAEIVSNLETNQAQIEEEISSKFETVQNLKRFKSCNDIGSKFEPKQDSENKTKALPTEVLSSAHAKAPEARPKKAANPDHSPCYRWFVERIGGKDPLTKGNVAALTWLLEASYRPEDIRHCFEYLLTDPWYVKSTVAVTLVEVKKKIQPWINAGRPEKHNGERQSGNSNHRSGGAPGSRQASLGEPVKESVDWKQWQQPGVAK